jgi:hypothetical protein
VVAVSLACTPLNDAVDKGDRRVLTNSKRAVSSGVTLPEHLIENSSYWLAGLKHRDERRLQPRLRNAETDEADRAVSAGATLA